MLTAGWWIGFLILTMGCDMGTTPPPSGLPVAFAYSVDGELDILNPDQAVTFTVHINAPAGIYPSGFFLSKSLNGGTTTSIGSYSEWPQSITFSLHELLSGWEGVSFPDLRKGDVLSIGMTATDEASFPQRLLEFPIGCFSDIAGEYTAMTIGRSGPGGGGMFDTIRYEVSLTDLGDGRYELSEVTGGMYPTIWGGVEESGILIDSCMQIILPLQKDQWDDDLQGAGELFTDGTIQYNWVNGYGDQGTTTLTKK